MNPSTRLKLGAVFFAIFWIVTIVWRSGSFSRANITGTAIGGALLGYVWYRFMRWWLSRRRIPARRPVSDNTEAQS